MNFEIIDNAYQVTVLLICMLLSAWLGIRKKNRGFIMLSFGYGCFMMGTLFFVLYLAILGRVPQIFYTCEISWLAAYLDVYKRQHQILLYLQHLRPDPEPDCDAANRMQQQKQKLDFPLHHISLPFS